MNINKNRSKKKKKISYVDVFDMVPFVVVRLTDLYLFDNGEMCRVHT